MKVFFNFLIVGLLVNATTTFAAGTSCTVISPEHYMVQAYLSKNCETSKPYSISPAKIRPDNVGINEDGASVASVLVCCESK